MRPADLETVSEQLRGIRFTLRVILIILSIIATQL